MIRKNHKWAQIYISRRTFQPPTLEDHIHARFFKETGLLETSTKMAKILRNSSIMSEKY